MGTESLTFTWKKNINLMTRLEFLAWGSDLWLILMGFYLPKNSPKARAGRKKKFQLISQYHTAFTQKGTVMFPTVYFSLDHTEAKLMLIVFKLLHSMCFRQGSCLWRICSQTCVMDDVCCSCWRGWLDINWYEHLHPHVLIRSRLLKSVLLSVVSRDYYEVNKFLLMVESTVDNFKENQKTRHGGAVRPHS